MKGWALVGLACLGLGCTPGQSTVRDAPETDEPVATNGQSAPVEGEEPIVSITPAAPKPVDPREVAGTYEMVLSDEQKKEIEKGLQSVRDLAAKGDEEAKKMLPQFEEAVKSSASASIVLNSDGTYLARVSGSEAKGKFAVLGSQVRFDAPEDGSPAAYPVMTHDAKGKRLLAKTGETTVAFVKKG